MTLDASAQLRTTLTGAFSLPGAAADWLCALFDSIQFLDDLADGDAFSRERLNGAIWELLAGMPGNPFFLAHASTLVPLVRVAILKWQASDKVEREGRADARSFVWRAGFVDLVLAVVCAVHGPAVATVNAHLVMDIYGEDFDAYRKEFPAHA